MATRDSLSKSIGGKTDKNGTMKRTAFKASKQSSVSRSDTWRSFQFSLSEDASYAKVKTRIEQLVQQAKSLSGNR